MFDIEGTGTSWTVTRNGQPVGNPTSSRLLALNKADRLAREAMVRTRPCLCCGAEFKSEGPHNRMCNPCRDRANDWMDEPAQIRIK